MRRLKCCLNYELDTYMDALKHFPTHANVIKTKGQCISCKDRYFQRHYVLRLRRCVYAGVFHPLDKEKVKRSFSLEQKGVFPEDLTSFAEAKEVEKEIGFADVTGEIELPNKKSKKKEEETCTRQGSAWFWSGSCPTRWRKQRRKE